MADPAAILDRLRATGANVVLDGKQMRLINGGKLSGEAKAYLVQHRAEIAALLQAEQDEAVEERAAIIEFDGHAPREWAEQFARVLIQHRPAGIREVDWSWFITTCGRIIDAAPPPEREAA
jgi:hypothetical protein